MSTALLFAAFFTASFPSMPMCAFTQCSESFPSRLFLTHWIMSFVIWWFCTLKLSVYMAFAVWEISRLPFYGLLDGYCFSLED
ncbi:hypothetical protein AVEN_132089-1 [Araneus ventricosus]|uniref:Secreted protein n=1 Tax=Araneus ventricosus TaxID=182803 RepID=A0A4Y2FBL7_ARAVE|nr:hypothetical protein AVEN_132089-1 [Araneus ventricosus]